MLPPLWEIMTFIHTQCRRRIVTGRSMDVVGRLLLYVFHVHQHLLPPLMFAFPFVL